ncbi:LysE family translocator [Neptuniibacter sp.]|uniref:LysE family translocator n=1 Tax=Neptuniibacter sp. TaxID=1962643 RepID=UPI002608919B|nr:LysE family translocator [Neptuniibacter sp.]MCP4596989.1 LysE family translocator [Neptuniibacter sp.]
MELYIAILVFAVSTTVTPGPNNIMILSSGVNYGVKRSLPHLLGICIGFPLMVAAVGLGFGSVFESFPIFHELIKVMGLTYLLYLAWKVATASTGPLETKDNNSRPMTFIQAVLFQWVNPKAWIMATGAIAAYTSQDSSILLQVIVISTVFFIAAFPCVGVWLFFGSLIQKYLKDEVFQKTFNVIMAALLVISVLPVVKDLSATYLV